MVLPQGKLRVAWELYRPNFGNTVTIQTGAWPFLSTHKTPLSLTAVCACAAPPQPRQQLHHPDRCNAC